MRSVLPVVVFRTRLASLDLARVDAEVGELADVRVGHDLEGERGERGLVGRRPCRLLGALRVDALDGRDVERAREVLHDRVEERLHALVLEGRAGEHRRDGPGEGAAPERAADHLGCDLALVLEVRLHELVVELGDGVDERVVTRLGRGREARRHVVDRELGAERVHVRDRLHLDEVDDPDEPVLLADREVDRHRVRAEPVAHRLHGRVEVRARAVHLVDEGDARDAVAVGLPPDGLRLRLDAGHGVEDGDRAVEHAQAPLDLHGKVHVPGRIDNVDPVVPPLGRRGRRGDGDAALLLLRHPVHRRGALVHLAHLVGAAGVVEDPLGRRGLARVDVGHDPDVADAVQAGLGCYDAHRGGYQR